MAFCWEGAGVLPCHFKEVALKMTCHQNAASNIYRNVFITLMCIFQSGLVFGNTNTFATKKNSLTGGEIQCLQNAHLIHESPYIKLLKKHG